MLFYPTEGGRFESIVTNIPLSSAIIVYLYKIPFCVSHDYCKGQNSLDLVILCYQLYLPGLVYKHTIISLFPNEKYQIYPYAATPCRLRNTYLRFSHVGSLVIPRRYIACFPLRVLTNFR